MAGLSIHQMDNYIQEMSHLSNSLKNIIQRCLQLNLGARYNLNHLLDYLCNDTINHNKIKTPFGNNVISNLKRLTLETNEPISKIEDDSKYLSLLNFDRKIVIPSSVEYLLFKKLVQPLPKGSIPASVKYLELGNEFDIQKNGDSLPKESILVLSCGFKFSEVIHEKCIPSSVTDLRLYNYNIELKSDSIPSSVVSLTLGSNFTNISSLSNLPYSIIDLTFDVQDENVKLSKEIDNINPNITSLIVNGKQRRN
ncbi:hypothetical protein ACTFIW_011774 [Dictyostelium discoideum]